MAKDSEQIVIPETLLDALLYLAGAIDQLDQYGDTHRNLLNRGEEHFVAETHHGIGRWMRNEWGLWKKEGPLYAWFKEQGLEHPDDMSGVILTTFYRRLKDVPEDIEGQIKFYQDYWKEHGGSGMSLTELDLSE